MTNPVQEQVIGDRVVLKVVGTNFTPYGHKYSAYITLKFKLQQYTCGHIWGNVDEDGKDIYNKEFLKNLTITARVTQAYQARTEGEEPHAPSQDDINNMYREVVGGMKKGRLYGLGSQAKVIFPHAKSTSRGMGLPIGSSAEIEEFRSENVELRARMVELEKSAADNTEILWT